MARILEHRALCKGKEVQTLLDPSFPFHTSTKGQAGPLGLFLEVPYLTGGCSTALQNHGPATVLGRKSGPSADLFAFPGGRSGPWCCSSSQQSPCKQGLGAARQQTVAAGVSWRHCASADRMSALHEPPAEKQSLGQTLLHRECRQKGGCICCPSAIPLTQNSLCLPTKATVDFHTALLF